VQFINRLGSATVSPDDQVAISIAERGSAGEEQTRSAASGVFPRSIAKKRGQTDSRLDEGRLPSAPTSCRSKSRQTLILQATWFKCAATQRKIRPLLDSVSNWAPRTCCQDVLSELLRRYNDTLSVALLNTMVNLY
jgi:hypothetical protein